jgi:hypothetical protein
MSQLESEWSGESVGLTDVVASFRWTAGTIAEYRRSG